MSSNLQLLAFITPTAGKIDRVVELLNEVAKDVKENEPNVYRFQIIREINKKSGLEEIIMLETYKDKAALAAHSSTDKFKIFQKKLKDEGLIAGPMKFKFVKDAGGFASRL